MPSLIPYTRHILLADDDDDDRLIFKHALEGLPLDFTLITVRDGVELMELLHTTGFRLPDILFLDINMPKKNGFECLAEIKADKKLNRLPVVIFSTFNGPEIVKQLYKNGAQYYIQKPSDLVQYKKAIYQALHLPKNAEPESLF